MNDNDNKETPLFSIGTVARMLGVSVFTLRLYERRGLILTRKSSGKQRLYTQLDIERLKCIRTSISKHKISIEGIRRIQSMVPCWENVQCPMEQRVACPAFTVSDAGCWTYKHKMNVCAGRDCLQCKVYLLAGDCEQIKSLVHHQPSRLSDKTDVLQKGK